MEMTPAAGCYTKPHAGAIARQRSPQRRADARLLRQLPQLHVPVPAPVQQRYGVLAAVQSSLES
jgi:hypothetical protein